MHIAAHIRHALRGPVADDGDREGSSLRSG
jgi:hypothetical protein